MHIQNIISRSRYLWLSLVAVIVVAIVSCSPVQPSSPTLPMNFSWSFRTETHNWTAGFAEYHVSANGQALDTGKYEMKAEHRLLPVELQNATSASAKAMFLQSHNRSDDMFMFLKRRITGLQPLKTYTIDATVRFASNEVLGRVGIGGAPAEAVFVKFGASAIEPKVSVVDGFVRFNLDKGNQANGGENAIVLGNIGISSTVNNAFVFKTLSTTPKLFMNADADGSLWIFVGTDSGYEGLTQIYYDHIEVVCTPR